MNPRLFAIALMSTSFFSAAGDSSAPAGPAPQAGLPLASPAPGENTADRTPALPPATDPATEAAIRGKVVITTNINGRQETRVLDLKAAGNVFEPFNYEDRPPVRTGPVAFLGVATTEVSRELSAQLPLPPETGLLIAAVAPDSPAAKAGLMESDVLCRIDDQILITTRQFGVLIANHKEGDSVKLTYYRKGQPCEATAVLGKHDAPAPVAAPDPLARITRHLLKIGPDGRIIQENKADEPGIVLTPGSHAEEELRKLLTDLPPAMRSEIEKTLQKPAPLPEPESTGTPPPPPAK